MLELDFGTDHEVLWDSPKKDILLGTQDLAFRLVQPLFFIDLHIIYRVQLRLSKLSIISETSASAKIKSLKELSQISYDLILNIPKRQLLFRQFYQLFRMRRTKGSSAQQEKAHEQKDRRNMTVPKPILERTLAPQTYKFYLGLGNNASLVRRVLSTRKNWQQIDDSKYLFLNMKWQQSNRGYKYDNCVQNRVLRQSLNHMQFHQELSNKEFLLKNLTEYCETHKMNVFDMLPVTYTLSIGDSNFDHIQHLFLKFFQHNLPENLRKKNRKQWMSFKRRPALNSSSSVEKRVNYFYCKPQLKDSYRDEETQYLWILKPTFFNRGTGIHLFNEIETLEDLMSKYIAGYEYKSSSEKSITQKNAQESQSSSVKVVTEETGQNGKPEKEEVEEKPIIKKKQFRIRESVPQNRYIVKTNSFIVQKYLQKPLLISGRKFDIRVWVLFTQQLKVYFFPQGYLRTSSYMYTNSQKSITDNDIHLTNNAVQKNNKDYGKYEDNNQLSFRHLENVVSGAGGSYEKLLGKMKSIVKATALSVRKKINKRERHWCYELFGYDFMVDSKCKPWLIEVNTNPCLEESSLLLEELLPRMLDDAFSLTIDQMFPQLKTTSYTVKNEIANDNLWELIVDLKK